MSSPATSASGGQQWVIVIGLLGIAGYVGTVSWAVEYTTYDVWGALLIGPALLVVSWPLLAAGLRREADPWVHQIVVVALLLKLAAGVARWAMAFILYEGVADASLYSSTGAALAENFRNGIFVVDVGPDLVGTEFIYLVTGVVYSLTGASIIGGYLVFSWLGFWGLFCLYRAARIALPAANHRRYAALVFLLPSLLFWPSGIGKEAWMTLCIGFSALGAAKLYTHERGAYLLLALGVAGTAVVRPHVTVLFFVGLFVGYLLRRPERRSLFQPITKIVGLGLLLVTGTVVASRAATFFGVDSLNPETVSGVLDETAMQTATGGSQFQASQVSSPADFPPALVSVLFRPFPWEAHNLQALLVAVEGFLLLGLLVLSWQRLRGLLTYQAGRPYAALCVAFTALFVYAFSSFGNFGILARERVMVYPFVLALACLPRHPASVQERDHAAVRAPARV